jgi:hypothetical protein
MSIQSIDDIQEKFDALVLQFFEGVRGEIAQNSTPSFNKILDAYNDMMSAIEHLNGINNTPTEQINRLQGLSAQYEEARRRVLKLEEQLINAGKKIDQQIELKI